MTASHKIISVLLLIIFLALLPSPGRAEEPFDLYIVPTVDDQLDSWLRTPTQLQPTIHLVDRVYPNQPFSLRLLFRGYTLSSLKNVHISYDVQFFSPDGKPTEDRGVDLLGYNGTVKGNNYIIINQQFLKVLFDDKYPPGDYEIKIIATDHLGKKTIAKSAKISFGPFEHAGNFASFDYFSFWIKYYFRQPDPAKGLFGILQYFENTRDWLRNNSRLLSFTNRLLKDNPWAWGHLEKIYKENAEHRQTIISLMALNNHQIPDITLSLSNAQKKWFEKVRELVKEPQRTPETLWGEFYATGHLQPVEEIVRLLKPFALSGAPEDQVRLEKLEEQAFWTLVEHGTDIPLVASYCSYLVEHAKLNEENSIQLRLALEVIKKNLEAREIDQVETDKKTPLPLTR